MNNFLIVVLAILSTQVVTEHQGTKVNFNFGNQPTDFALRSLEFNKDRFKEINAETDSVSISKNSLAFNFCGSFSVTLDEKNDNDYFLNHLDDNANLCANNESESNRRTNEENALKLWRDSDGSLVNTPFLQIITMKFYNRKWLAVKVTDREDNGDNRHTFTALATQDLD